MRLPACLVLASSFVLLVSACGGGSGGSSDPRCTSLCTIQQPADPNIGQVCSQTSADACLQLCGAQIAGTMAACGDCLLMDASFGTESGSSGPGCMSPSTMCPGSAECTESGWGGTCTYCMGDTAAQHACDAQVYPRQEVDCPTTFGDPTKCSALCAAK
jgi:hypothetical protein